MRLCSEKWVETDTSVSDSRMISSSPLSIVFQKLRSGLIHLNRILVEMRKKGVYEVGLWSFGELRYN